MKEASTNLINTVNSFYRRFGEISQFYSDGYYEGGI